MLRAKREENVWCLITCSKFTTHVKENKLQPIITKYFGVETTTNSNTLNLTLAILKKYEIKV